MKLLLILRQRFWWVASITVTMTGLAVVLALRVEPAYRATTTMRVEGRTLPLGFDTAEIRQYAEDDLHSRATRVLSPEALGQPVDPSGSEVENQSDARAIAFEASEVSRRFRVGVVDAESEPQPTGDLSDVSYSFVASFDAASANSAERVLRALQTRFLTDDLELPAPVPALSDEGSADVNRLAETIATLEAQIATFERQNAAGLPELHELNAQAMQRADRERTQLDGQILAMEERRMDLDRALRDIERDAASDREGEEINPLTSHRLVALQSERAVLLGLYGADNEEAVELDVAISDLQRDADGRLDRATAELRSASEDLANLERVYEIDHPDVVRLAHRVSALENQIETLTVTGLTVGERRYIEGLARERREIDGRIEELRVRHESLRESVADYESRALQGPVLEQQYRVLQEELLGARAEYETALAAQEALAFERRIALQTRPGSLRIVEPVLVAGALSLTQPWVVASLGAIVGAILSLLVALLLDRVDRRISGAQRIRELQGSEPLAEIPFIRLQDHAFAGSAAAGGT